MPIKLFMPYLFAVLLFFNCLSVFAASDLSRSEAAPMESYLNHFMAVSRDNLSFGSPDKPEEAKKILRYAQRFAQIDDSSKFQPCPRENCPYGDLRVEKRYVDEAIKRYFGHDPQNYPLLNGKGADNFERGYYHVQREEKLDFRARVREAKVQPVGLVLMRGDVLDHMGEIVDKFSALAWPVKFGTQDTWALVSLAYDSGKKK